MNRIFGVASTGHSDTPFDRTVMWLDSDGQGRADILDMSPESVRCATISDGGRLLGRASDSRGSLAYLGTFHQPFPDWHEGAPLDDPNHTATDLLARYREQGNRFLDGLYGQYVVVVLDLCDSRLLIARDPGGNRRFFVCESGGTLLFSSKLADFHGLLGDELKVDRSLEEFLLGYEFVPWNRTPFLGVEVLPPGTLLEWKNGELRRLAIAPPVPWWEPLQPFRDSHLTESEVIESLDVGFRTAIEEQLPSERKVAVLLGGFDSALIAAMLTYLGKKVETFSFCYADTSYNQTHTEELAGYLGIRHNWVPIDADVIKDGIQHYALRFNQLTGQPHYLIATSHACKTIRERGFFHCFTGDGCDGLFLGYPTVHLRAKFVLALSKVAPVLQKPLNWVTRSESLEKRLGHPYRVIRNVSNVLKRPPHVRAHIASRILDDFSLRLIRGSAPPQEADVEMILEELARGLEHMSAIKLAYHGKEAVGLNKNKFEGSADYSGLTLVSPYLHPGFAALAKSVPEQLSRPRGSTRSRTTGKHAFMRMAQAKGYLPETIIYQKKRSPVTAPVDAWYLGPLREIMLDQFAGLPFEINRKYAEALLTPKLAEELFRRYIGLGRFATHAASVLATHASFTKLASGPTH